MPAPLRALVEFTSSTGPVLGCAIARFGTAAAFPREAVLGFDQLVGDSPPKE